MRYWERVVSHAPPGQPVPAAGAGQHRRGAQAAARCRRRSRPPRHGQRRAIRYRAAARVEAGPTPLAGATIRGTVRLAPALADRAAPTDTVFIYARPAEGSRMPLAILRKQVKDLPVEFTLDDSMAMSPAAKLSLFPKVVVSARVSKSGQAVPSAGDLVGETPAMANHGEGVALVIDQVVGR